MNQVELIKKELNGYRENELIVARTLYKKMIQKNEVSEFAFYKVFERLIRSNELVRVSKGIYTKPVNSEYGVVPISEKTIVDYFTNHNKGMVVGYSMYNTNKLTTQVANNIKLYSNNLSQETKTIDNVKIERVDINFTYENVRIMQLLEVLENYQKIEDINTKMFMEFTQEMIKSYTNKRFISINSKKKYKKSTISFLKQVLENSNIKNNLNQFLSSTSKYKIPSLGVNNETT